MERAPSVLPVLGVIIAPEINADEVVAGANDRLFEVGSRTEPEPFDSTDYYRPEMGAKLIRFWCAGCRLAAAEELADWKSRSRELETRWGDNGARRVNLDPGYISSLQLVLATTKLLPQAVYLRDGISALVELLYCEGRFVPLPWTYPDYRKAAEKGVFEPLRAYFLELLRKAGA